MALDHKKNEVCCMMRRLLYVTLNKYHHEHHDKHSHDEENKKTIHNSMDQMSISANTTSDKQYTYNNKNKMRSSSKTSE